MLSESLWRSEQRFNLPLRWDLKRNAKNLGFQLKLWGFELADRAIKYGAAGTTNPMVMAMLVGFFIRGMLVGVIFTQTVALFVVGDRTGNPAVFHITGGDGGLGKECGAVAESQ